jgi:hypothetical protein
MILASCSQREPTQTGLSATGQGEFKSYKLDLNSTKTKFYDIIESIEIMRLEETTESFLSDIFRVSQYNNQFIFNSIYGTDIFVFDSLGNFSKKFNRKGEGPEEYKMITDLWLEQDTVVVYSRDESRINRYSLEGAFISSSKLPFRVNHIHGLNGGYGLDMGFNTVNDSSKYKYVVLDKLLNPAGFYLPFEMTSFQVLSSLNSVMPYSEGLLFFRNNSDTVYWLNGDKLSPLIHFDFGDDWYWKGKTEPTQKDLSEIGLTDHVWDIDQAVGERELFISGSIGFNRRESFLIDRANGQSKRIDIRKTPEEIFHFRNLGWEMGRLMFSSSPSDLLLLVSQLDEEKIKFRQGTTLKEIESSENPVLMWVKFKEEY